MKKSILFVFVVLMLGVVASAQITNPATATTQITALKGESLTVSASAVGQFAIAAGASTSTANQDLTITTTGNFVPGRTSVAVCAGMTSAGMTGTGGNTDVIPVGNVLASTASTFAALNAGPGCSLASGVTVVSTNALTVANRKAFSKSDVLHLQLSGLATNLQADLYTGTVTVYAYVTP